MNLIHISETYLSTFRWKKEERSLENPEDVAPLRSLMEVKIKSRKLKEAIEIIN